MIRFDRRGQSFVEAMIAITIMVSSVSSAMALVQSSVTASRVSGSQVVAANLAREGLEVVRSIRDSNWLRGRGFSEGLADPAVKTAVPSLNLATGEWTLSFADLDLSDDRAAIYVTREGLSVNSAFQPAGSARSLYNRLLTLKYVCRDDASGAERVVAADGEACALNETLVGIDAISSLRWVTLAGTRRVFSIEEKFYDWR